MWLDAADEDTIEHTAGAVSKWTSKDSNGREFVQSSGSLQPTTGSTTCNGLNTIDFDGDYLTSDDAASVWKFLHDGTKHHVFAVVKFANTSTPANNTFYGCWGTTAAQSGNVGEDMLYGRTAENPNFLSHRVARGVSGAANQAVSHTPSNFVTPNTYELYYIRSQPAESTASNRSRIRKNAGTAWEANTLTNAPSSSNPSHTLDVGSTGNGVFPLGGQIAELIIYERDISAQEVEDVTEYLAEKWGIDLE